MDVFENVEGVAKIISVSPSTVKKYYGLFEKEGYRFNRSNEGYLLFSEYEIDLLKELIFLKNQPNMTISKAVREIARREGISDISGASDTTTDISVMSSQVATVMSELAELKELVKQQNAFIKQQQDHIDRTLKERDHKLMESLRDSQEVKQQLLQIAVAQEEKKKRKGLFKLFSKD